MYEPDETSWACAGATSVVIATVVASRILKIMERPPAAVENFAPSWKLSLNKPDKVNHEETGQRSEGCTFHPAAVQRTRSLS
ncbi:hypothetical protein HerbRD11066_26920 [Herbidospora sp. RD11066]